MSGSRQSFRPAVVLAAGALACAGLSWTKPAAAVPGLELVSAGTSSDSSSSKIAIATCPAGKQVLGTGGNITVDTGSADAGKLLLHQVFPNPSLTTVTVVAAEVPAGFAGNWHLTAHAICALPIANLQRVKTSVATSLTTPKQGLARCPTNLFAYGAGFAIQGAAGSFFPTDVSLQELVTVGQVQTRVDSDNSPSPSAWGLDTLVICASKAPGYQVVSNGIFPGDSTSPKSLSLTCPAGKRVHGSGFRKLVDPATFNADLVVEDWTMTAGLVSVTVKAHENDPIAANWGLDGTVVCVN